MTVLRTIEDHRRRIRRVLAVAFAWSFSVLTLAAGWWLMRPGRVVDEALGVAVPSGSRQLHEEHTGADRPFAAVYLTTTAPLSETMARFEAVAAEASPSSRRYVLPDGTVVYLSPAQDVPATRLTPIHPVSEGVPLGTRSWIVVTRGEPPDSTWAVSVPPVGES